MTNLEKTSGRYNLLRCLKTSLKDKIAKTFSLQVHRAELIPAVKNNCKNQVFDSKIHIYKKRSNIA